jgi:alkylated DNA repair dioxygenase AlkB
MSAASQASLFPQPPSMPEGFRYAPEFIAPDEEAALLARVEGLAFAPFEFHGFEGKRAVVYFGWRYDFSAGRLDRAEPIPPFLLPLRDRAAAFAGLAPEAFGHVLINKYEPGAPIGWHRDRPQFAEVAGVSLGSPARFRMRRRTADGWERRTTMVEPRSLYLLRGPARSEWEHSIPPAPALRYSITFRSLTAVARARLEGA